jgi:hypothetical protein
LRGKEFQSGFQPMSGDINMKKNHSIKLTVLSLCTILLMCTEFAFAESTSQRVNWQGPGGSVIKEIRYLKVPPKSREPLFAASMGTETQTAVVLSNVIDSPPVDGFVPWIAVAVTDARGEEFDPSAVPHLSVTGNPLTSTPSKSFAVGIFDTGASAHVLSYATGITTGIYANADDLLTPNMTEIQGVSGSVYTWVSQPLGIFINGLGAIEPNSPADPNDWILNRAGMVGQSNVAVSVGDEPMEGAPDLPTAIGSPMAVNFTAVIQNDRKIWAKAAGITYTGPQINFYNAGDSRIPAYSTTIPLNLIPTGSSDVQFIPDYEAIMEDLTYRPWTPSIILGTAFQSLFFVNSVSLYDGAYSAILQDRFMLDTGAQVTVVGSNVGSLLGFDPANPEFEVVLMGVTGETITAPGFYIDALNIPALGQWLEYTNVPVVMLDITSPEGGTLDGIIGMNLFNEYNMVLKGDYTSPSLKVQRILPSVLGDIAPVLRDGRVDLIDLGVFSQAWMSTGASINWYPYADLAPAGSGDGVVDLLDLAVLAKNWLNGTD